MGEMELRELHGALWLVLAWACLALWQGPEVEATAPRCADEALLQVDGGEARGGTPLLLCPEAVGDRPARPPTGAVGLLVGRPIDVDAATEDELQALPGIGPGLARRIVEERAARGPFGVVDGLSRVRGLGPARIRALGELATAGRAGGGAGD
jgi:competence protein ComEA